MQSQQLAMLLCKETLSACVYMHSQTGDIISMCMISPFSQIHIFVVSQTIRVLFSKTCTLNTFVVYITKIIRSQLKTVSCEHPLIKKVNKNDSRLIFKHKTTFCHKEHLFCVPPSQLLNYFICKHVRLCEFQCMSTGFLKYVSSSGKRSSLCVAFFFQLTALYICRS